MSTTIDELKTIYGEEAVEDTIRDLVSVYDNTAYEYTSPERFLKTLKIAEDLRDAICYPDND